MSQRRARNHGFPHSPNLGWACPTWRSAYLTTRRSMHAAMRRTASPASAEDVDEHGAVLETNQASSPSVKQALHEG